MWRRTVKLSLVASLVVLGSAAPSRADVVAEEPRIPRPASSFPWFAGVGAGVGYPTVAGTEIASSGSLAATFTLHAGYTIRDRLAVGLEFTGVETEVGRDQPGQLFQVGYTPQAACTTCTPKPPGADVLFTSLVFSTFGARVEYAPFGRDGLFVGGTAGLAFMVGLAPQSGFGAGGRLGYRFRPASTLAVSFEAGVQGQLYGDATMFMPYGAAVLRPSF